MASDNETLYVVRLWDGFDFEWTTITEPLPYDEAEAVWNEKTHNGTKNTTFDHIDYYKIFTSDSQMLWTNGRPMFRREL